MFGSTVAVQVTESADVLAELLTSATIGDYDIYGELGRGGMAAVYLALDLSLNRKVAIKTMLPELVAKTDMVQRFKREAQTSAGLNHPHIIQIHSVKETKELVYFVMKFIEGRSLESVLHDGQLAIGVTQVVLNQVASALAYAHRKGVVHRDVKPANIMLDEDGWAIVTDFGIAKVQVAQNLTATGTAIGTPTYMSPEQFHNKAITGKSDQYSLGIVAYELLLGRKPFDGDTYAEIITQHLFTPVPNLRELRPDLPENMAAAVQRMLAKNPDERFPDLDAAATALGSPDKAEGDRIRGEMISLAKGARRTVRMSVPVSPIPMTKKPAAATQASSAATAVVGSKGAAPVAPAARTVPERALPKRAPAPAPSSVTSGSGTIRLYAAIAAGVVLVGVFVAWKAMSSGATEKPAAVTAEQTPPTVAPSGAPTAPSTTTSTSSGGTEPAAKTPPPVSAPDAPAPVRVSVTDVPSGAVITLDGRRQSGQEFSARAGTHQLRVEARGFESMTRRITLKAGEPFTISFDRRVVAAAPPPVTKTAPTKQAPAVQQGLATLRLIVQPPAVLYIDGASKGEQRGVLEEMVPGTHTLRAEKPGFITKDTVVTILAGQTATIRLSLTPRP